MISIELLNHFITAIFLMIISVKGIFLQSLPSSVGIQFKVQSIFTKFVQFLLECCLPSLDVSSASSRWQLKVCPGMREELSLKEAPPAPAPPPSFNLTLAESDLHKDSSLENENNLNVKVDFMTFIFFTILSMV